MKQYSSDMGEIDMSVYTTFIPKIVDEKQELKRKKKAQEVAAEANKKMETMKAELNQIRKENRTKRKW